MKVVTIKLVLTVARRLNSSLERLDTRRRQPARSPEREVLRLKNAGQNTVTMDPIGTVRSPYTAAAQIPKGAGAEHRAEGVIEILPEYETGLTDIEGFSHLYVLWIFDRVSGWDLLATPPTDTRSHGVFATRAPTRPNPIGLTVVTLLGRDGCKLHVRGVDMLDGTPILDIKPYLSSVPAEELRRGWLAEAESRKHGRL